MFIKLIKFHQVCSNANFNQFLLPSSSPTLIRLSFAQLSPSLSTLLTSLLILFILFRDDTTAYTQCTAAYAQCTTAYTQCTAAYTHGTAAYTCGTAAYIVNCDFNENRKSDFDFDLGFVKKHV